ncbi:MAG: ABC transporter ATP-binding protein [Chloroflexia bacterium]
MNLVIETTALTKRYSANRGIKNVNLTVGQGEVFGFLGPNGAGKTTTIRTLLDFLHPTSGRALLFGLDSQRDSVAIRARLGILPTEFTLDDRLTGDDLLRLFARLRGVRDLGYARELAGRLDADLRRPMRRLSRGNKQKIGLIAALFHRPDLLILDEPTGGLDPLVQEEFLAIVAETKAEGRTIFLSSHILSEVERVCDRVAIIRDGEIVTIETIAGLLNRKLRYLTLTFDAPVDASPFAALPGIDGVKRDGATIRMTLSDGQQLDRVIKLAATHTIVDFRLDHPSLEENFLSFYDRNNKTATAQEVTA